MWIPLGWGAIILEKSSLYSFNLSLAQREVH